MLILSETLNNTTESTDADIGVSFPILMYHNISENSRRWDKYTISPDELEADLKYLKENGYETVVMTDIINYVHNGDPLPEKPIILTFDDGASSDYQYLFPLLKEYDMKAVVSIIGYVTDEYSASAEVDAGMNYPHLIWSQIQEMVDSGLVEIQNHSYNLHGNNGAKEVQGESNTEYRVRLLSDLIQLQDRIEEEIGIRPNTFTYPYGFYNENSERILGELGFSASLVCEERINTVYVGNTSSLYKLGRIVRPHGKSTIEVLQKIGIEE